MIGWYSPVIATRRWHCFADPSQAEQEILGALPYADNDVVLHTDTRLLPDRKLAWASWNYRLSGNIQTQAAVTYDMNILQGIDSATTFCVSLNQTPMINPLKILARFTYAHPQYSLAAVAAQKPLRKNWPACATRLLRRLLGQWFPRRRRGQCAARGPGLWGNPVNSALYSGWIAHRRFAPKAHAFRYRIGLLYLDLSEQDEVLGLSPLADQVAWRPSAFVSRTICVNSRVTA